MSQVPLKVFKTRLNPSFPAAVYRDSEEILGRFGTEKVRRGSKSKRGSGGSQLVLPGKKMIEQFVMEEI